MVVTDPDTGPKKLIEDAYALGGVAGGLPVWCGDEAGPFQTVPPPGASWRPGGGPARQPREYVRNGTAKGLTLFHPPSGRVEVEGATSATNAVLHAWLKRGLTEILAGLPVPGPVPPGVSSRATWGRWQAGLAGRSRCRPTRRRYACCWCWTTLRGTGRRRSSAGCSRTE